MYAYYCKEGFIMKKILLFISCIVLILNVTSISHASDVTLNISAQFKCNFLAKYMKKHGYHYIKEVPFRNNMRTNLFAANNAEVVIKNKHDAVLATGSTDIKGNVSIKVPADSEYKVIVKFHDREYTENLNISNTHDFVADFGFFESDAVGSWIRIPALSYCNSCGIRHLDLMSSL